MTMWIPKLEDFPGPRYQALASAIEAYESDLVQDALKSTRGNIAKAAKMLDSTERILGYKIKKYGIDARRFRG